MKLLRFINRIRLIDRAGQSLVEAVVAMSLIFFGILGVYSLAARAVSLNRVVADRYVAIYLGSEGIEVVKNIIDSNVLQRRPWNEGVANGDYEVEYKSTALHLSQERPLLYDPDAGFYNYTTGRETTFRRTIRIDTLGDGEELKVVAQVSWLSRGGNYSIDIEDHFLNWR